MKTQLIVASLLIAGFLPAQDRPAAPAPARPDAAQEQFLSIPTPGRFRNFFLPFRTDIAALSPDGRFIAYSVREGEKLFVAVVEAANPEKIKTAVLVGDDHSSTPMLSVNQAENTPARIKWMGWATATRLVVETNRKFPRYTGTRGWESQEGAVMAFDADESNARLLLQPIDLPIPAPLLDSDFTIVRNRSAPIKGTWQASDPLFSTSQTPPGSTNTEDFDLAAPTDPIQSPGDTAEPVSSPTRALRVFDYDPQRPGNLTVVATSLAQNESSQRLDFYSLDPANGKLTSLNYDFVPNSRSSLIDRQGEVRLTLPNSYLSKFPFRYAYRGPRGNGRDRPLNDTVKLADFSVNPENFFGVRAIPLGFDHDPNVLYYADNTGRDTYGIYSLNLATGQRGSLAMENPAYDLITPPTSAFSPNRALVYDRYDHRLAGVRYENAMRSTAWIQPELNALQDYLEKYFPGRSVEISDWDEARHRYLVATEGPADAGAFYLFDREKNRLTEFARRAPWIDAEHTHPSLPFSFTAAGGTRISGLVTVPNKPHLKPIPMIVLCPTWPWQRVDAGFSTEVQALTDMGFVVLQLNGRGAWGLGLKHRQPLAAGYDAVQVEDIAGSIEHVERIFRINPQRVALIGFGHGGFIALRALQSHPEKFRCAIALDAPVDLGSWLTMQKWEADEVQSTLMKTSLGDAASLKAAPLASHPEAVTKPVLMLNYPGPDGGPRRSDYVAARHFAGQVRRHGAVVEFGDLRTDYMRGLPEARAAVFDRIEAFLNVNVYDFKVELQEMKIIK